MSTGLVIKTGIYQHYKGPKYEVLGETLHSETEEKFVLYRALYGELGLWVRPATMFSASVSVDGADVPRFKMIEEYPLSLGRFDPSLDS